MSDPSHRRRVPFDLRSKQVSFPKKEKFKGIRKMKMMMKKKKTTKFVIQAHTVGERERERERERESRNATRRQCENGNVCPNTITS